MIEPGFFIKELERLAGWAWIPVFRIEVILLAVSAAVLWPQIRKTLGNSDKRILWALGAIISAYCLLIFIRTGGQFYTFEDWEELYLGKLAVQGKMELFKGIFRHGTTYPFLLADLYGIFGLSPEVAVFLNIALILSAPVFIFLASRTAFSDKRSALCSTLLFCVWPGLVKFAVLAQGKSGLVIAETAAFAFAVSMVLSVPRPASFGLLFIITDLAAKTRQEFGLLYPIAFLVWFWADKAKGKNWWIPFLALCAATLYYPLLARGVDCHIHPIKSIIEIPGGGVWWIVFTAMVFLIVLLQLLRRAFRRKNAFFTVLVSVFSLISAVYFFNPGGPQERLFVQIAPLLCIAAGPAFFPAGILVPLCAVIGFYSWNTDIIPRYPDTPAALAGLAAVKRSGGDILLFPGLNALSEWQFWSDRRGAEISLDGAARLIDTTGMPGHGIQASAGYSLISGRDVWLVGWDRDDFWKSAYARLSSAGRKEYAISSGGWRMEKFRFPGITADPSASKSLSDIAVKELLSGRFDEGEALLLKALELNPRNTDAILSLAAVRAHHGALKECINLVAGAKKMMSDDWTGNITESAVCGYPPKGGRKPR